MRSLRLLSFAVEQEVILSKNSPMLALLLTNLIGLTGTAPALQQPFPSLQYGFKIGLRHGGAGGRRISPIITF